MRPIHSTAFQVGRRDLPHWLSNNCAQAHPFRGLGSDSDAREKINHGNRDKRQQRSEGRTLTKEEKYSRCVKLAPVRAAKTRRDADGR